MNDSRPARERDRVLALANTYRSQGYEVALGPSPADLPDFLVGYQPDLIVSRGDERAVVEVKSRRSLSADAQAREIAKRVEGQEGWSFELVIVGDESATPPPGSAPPDTPSIQHALEESRSLVANGYSGPALLNGWATFEAAVRLLLSAEGVELRRLDSASVLKQAVEEGLISRDEYRAASDVVPLRNALAHGFKSPPVSPEDVSRLLDLTERLLNEASAQESA